MFGFRTYETQNTKLEVAINPVLVKADVELYNYDQCPKERKSLVDEDGLYGVFGRIISMGSKIETVNKYTKNLELFI